MMRNNDKKTNAPVEGVKDDVKIYVPGKSDIEMDTLEYWKQCAQDAITANQQLTKDYYDLQQEQKNNDRSLQWYKDKLEKAERGNVIDNTPTLSDIITGAKRGNYVLDLHIRISSKNGVTTYGTDWSDEDE